MPKKTMTTTSVIFACDQNELYKPLNQPTAIAKHPIAHHLAAFDDWGIGDLVGDQLYCHPKGHKP